ncbi:MAG: hypothetical protein RJQ08_11525 [Salinisphaeraceae bacterium]
MSYAEARDQARAEKRMATQGPRRDERELPRSTELDSIERATRADRLALHEYQRLSRGQAEAAYRRGVADTMEEFRGQLHGQRGFVWEEPVVEMVEMPARVINGALVPRHMSPVVISPGRWVESNGVDLPEDPYALPEERARRGVEE